MDEMSKSADSKVVLVTGGGRGLGRFVAQALSAQGHRVVLTARSRSAGESAAEAIRRAVPSARVDAKALDLASLDAIRQFAASLDEGLRFDTVCHVAGVMQQSRTRRVTADGFEETLAVNTLAPFLLTHELLPRIGREGRPGRVMCVSSRLHLPGSRGASVNFDFDDPNLAHGYDPERAYKNSKLALLWFVYELARRVPRERFTVHAVCPGFVPATAAASVTGFQHLLLKYVLPHAPFATSVRDAVDSLRFMAVDPRLDASTGEFWGEKQVIASSPQSRDPQDAARFWAWAERATRSGTWAFS